MEQQKPRISNLLKNSPFKSGFELGEDGDLFVLQKRPPINQSNGQQQTNEHLW